MPRNKGKKKLPVLKLFIDPKILALFILAFLFCSVFLLSYYLRHAGNTTLITKAEDLGEYCDNPPDCCANIAKTGDAHECDWPWRKYCRPDQCQIAEGNPRERCGVAYIEDWPYGCVGKPPPGVTVTPTGQPTVYVSPTPVPPTIAPTAVPTIFYPTAVPTYHIIPTVVVISPTGYTRIDFPSPTSYIIPTAPPFIMPSVPAVQPTDTPIPSPTPKPLIREAVREVGNWLSELGRKVSGFLKVVLP